MKAHFHNSNNSSMLFISIAATSMLLIIQFTNLTKIFSLYDSVSNIPNLKDWKNCWRIGKKCFVSLHKPCMIQGHFWPTKTDQEHAARNSWKCTIPSGDRCLSISKTLDFTAFNL